MKKLKIIVITILIAAGVFALYSATDRSRELNEASASIETLHNDRLVAANYIYHASDLLHNKRVLIEKLEQVNAVALAEENQSLTPRVRELLTRFQSTRLTAEEKSILNALFETTREIEAIEGDQLYSYQVRERLRWLNTEALVSLRTLADIQLKEGTAAAATGQSAASAGGISDNLVTAIFVVGLIGLIFFFSGVTRKTGGLGRPYVRYLNSLMM